MAGPEWFDTRWAAAPDEFSLGFLTLTGLRAWPGRLYYPVGESKQLVFRLEELDASGGQLSMIWFCMDIRDRPEGFGPMKTFHSTVEFYRKRAGPFPLAGLDRFDAGMLSLPTPPGWRHEAFQRPAEEGPGGNIVHTYVGDGQSLLVRYSRAEADLVEHPRFLAINAGLSLHPGRWTVVPAAIDIPEPPGPVTTAGPLSAEVLGEITEACGRACLRLGVTMDTAAGAWQDAIHDYVHDWLFADAARGGDDVEDVAVDLGCLYGQSLCETLAWEWVEVAGEGATVFAVASPDRAVFVPPMVYLQRQLKQEPRTADNTVLLLVNLLRQGDPKDRPGQLRQRG